MEFIRRKVRSLKAHRQTLAHTVPGPSVINPFRLQLAVETMLETYSPVDKVLALAFFLSVFFIGFPLARFAKLRDRRNVMKFLGVDWESRKLEDTECFICSMDDTFKRVETIFAGLSNVARFVCIVVISVYF